MGKKYIIELEETPFIQHFKNGAWETIYRVKGFNSLVFDWNGLQMLTPYTEPDLEQVRKEAYKEGVEDGKELCSVPEVCHNNAYQKGLSNAWEACRKIVCYEIDGGYPVGHMLNLFERDDIPKILSDYTAAEAIEKIRQYEQEKEEIKVGDEVVSEDDIKAVVIDMDNYLLHVLDENGVVQGWPREDVAKTDRHFPEIAAVLEKMRGEQDE